MQSKFRELVEIRDATCLTTDFYYELCTACHIVPQSRPDVSSFIIRVSARSVLMIGRCISRSSA
jgi:hypothetical protein